MWMLNLKADLAWWILLIPLSRVFKKKKRKKREEPNIGVQFRKIYIQWQALGETGVYGKQKNPAWQNGGVTLSRSRVRLAAESLMARVVRSSWYCLQFMPSWIAWWNTQRLRFILSYDETQSRHPDEPSPTSPPSSLTLQSRQLCLRQTGQWKALTVSS